METFALNLSNLIPAYDWTFENPVAKILQNYTDPIQEVIKLANAPLEALSAAIAEDPRFATAPAEAEKIQYLTVAIDSVGYFVIDGHTIHRCHSVDSACGRILRWLIRAPHGTLTYDEMETIIGASDRIQVLKDLRRQLKRYDYKMVYKITDGKSMKYWGITTI